MTGEFRYDAAKVLAKLVVKDRKISQVRDEQLPVVQHGDGPLHLHIALAIRRARALPRWPLRRGRLLSGTRRKQSDHRGHPGAGHHGAGMTPGCGPECRPQRFTRILTASVAVTPEGPKKAAGAKRKKGPKKRR